MSVRDAMRGLLGRKSSSQKFPDYDHDTQASKHDTFLPPLDLAGERVFPIRNTQGDSDQSWLSSNAQAEGLKQNQFIEHSLFPNPPKKKTEPTQKPTITVSEATWDFDEDNDRKVSRKPEIVSLKQEPKPTPYHRCEDEPIHTPGAIQNFGALIGLKYSSKKKLEVRVASENTRKVLGYGPEQLFALPCFLDALEPSIREEMVTHVEHILKKPEAINEETRLDIFQITLSFPNEPDIRLWCAIHLAPSDTNLIICEFEEYIDSFYNKELRAAQNLPLFPAPAMGFESSPQVLAKSTKSASKPLPVIEIARQRRDKGFTSTDLFNALSQAQKQISGCGSVQEVLEVVVGLTSELTGYHRVMAYRFDAEHNGCVDAELLNPDASPDCFRGMHFPASDIPVQARKLYITNRIRLLHDRDAQTARLVCRNETDFEKPLDLTHSYLRAMSPVHNKYLANMGVRSTMSISIVINGELWGLVACHGYGDDGIRISLPIRELCRNIGDYAAINIKQLIMSQRVEAFRPPTLSSKPLNLTTSSTYLLKLVDADFALLSIDGEARAIGRLDPYPEALAVMAHIQSLQLTEIRCSHNLNEDFPGINFEGGVKTIAGLLFVPFHGGGGDFVIFFRKEQLKHLKWAGNPYEKKMKRGSEYLTPRSSFQQWGETVAGTSRNWTEDQKDAAWVLSIIYGKVIEILGNKASVNQKSKMSSIRTSTHELRAPLNAIVNCIEMALENKIDEKTRQVLGRAQQASMSSVQVVEELLRLTKVEDTNPRSVEKGFNLNQTVSKVIKALQKEAQRKALDLTASVHEQLPGMVRGDGDSFREVLVHLISNAFKRSKNVAVEVNITHTEEMTTVIGLTVQDLGPGMSETELDDTFQQFEQAQDDEDWLFASEDPKPSKNNKSQGHSDLSVIARYVRSVDGQIRVTSQEGKGTAFIVELPFEHIPSSDAGVPRKLRKLFSPSSGAKVPSPRSTPPPAIKVSTQIPKHSQNFNQPSPDQPSPDMQTRIENDAYHSSSSSIANQHPHLRGPSAAGNHRDENDTYHSTLSPIMSSQPQPRPRVSSASGNHSQNNGSDSSNSNSNRGSGSNTKDTTSSRQSRHEDSSPKYMSKDSSNYSPSPSRTPSRRARDSNSTTLSASTSTSNSNSNHAPRAGASLHVLVAEDNFVSQRMIEKKLSQYGHSVIVASDGQEAHDKFVTSGIGAAAVDVILMDLKMPLVDGALSARMIRFWEKESSAQSQYRSQQHSDGREISPHAQGLLSKSRVMIIAVAASLGDENRFDYIQNGFDGWIAKPIDFRRLELMIQGVKDPAIKRESLYIPGQENGGWFFP